MLNLKTRISLATLSGILLLGIGMGSYFLYQERKMGIESAKREITKSSSFLVPQSYLLLKQKDESNLLRLSQVIRQSLGRGDFAYVEICDSKENLVLPYNPFESLSGRIFRHTAYRNLLELGPDFLIQENRYPDLGPVLEGVFKIIDKGKDLGSVSLGVSLKPIQKEIIQNLIWTGSSLGILLVLSILLGTFLIRKSIHSLERSKKEMKTLLDISSRLGKVLNLSEAVQELTMTAKQIVYCNETGILWKIQDPGLQSIFKQTEYVSKNLIDHLEPKNNFELIADVSKSRWKDFFDPSVRSSLLFPILSPNHHCLGYLYLIMTGRSQFDPEDVHLLSGGMKFVGLFFENVFLYSEKERLSRQDSMTGLLNRQEIVESLVREIQISQRRGSSCSLLMIDIDHFKTINDTYGHLAGDRVIRLFSKIIQNARRIGEKAGRYGGEEFLVILPDTDLSGAQTVAEKILSEVRDTPISISSERQILFTVSIGIASYPDDGLTAEELISKSDSALYAAKSAGRNRSIRWNLTVPTPERVI